MQSRRLIVKLAFFASPWRTCVVVCNLIAIFTTSINCDSRSRRSVLANFPFRWLFIFHSGAVAL